jgi:hypothetical protein
MVSLADLPLSAAVAFRFAFHIGERLHDVHDDAAAMELWTAEFVPAAVHSLVCVRFSLLTGVRLPCSTSLPSLALMSLRSMAGMTWGLLLARR